MMFTWYYGVQWCITPVAVTVAVVQGPSIPRKLGVKADPCHFSDVPYLAPLGETHFRTVSGSTLILPAPDVSRWLIALMGIPSV